MEQSIDGNLSETQKQIFEKICKNETGEFMQLMAHLKGGVNFVDESGMTPLQQACSKGNLEAVKLLMDLGGDVNYSRHGANYTPLHLAALSGNVEICNILLAAGIDPNAVNSVSRTASEMAAFVGNHDCVQTINHHVPRSQLEYYTQLHGQQTEPYLHPILLDNTHKFVSAGTLHPVRIALNLQSLNLLKHLANLRKILELMCEQEVRKTHDLNEVMALKFHYLGWIISELVRCQEQSTAQRKDESPGATEVGRHDFVELFVKRVLRGNKLGQLDYLEFTIRECVRGFPFRECTVFRRVIAQLAKKNAPEALRVLRRAINGQRGFMDDLCCCVTCGNEKPAKKCSKCKEVQYCDRECQRLHWFMHKKTCARPTSDTSATAAASKGHMDRTETHAELAKLIAS